MAKRGQPTDEELRAAIELIRRAHPSQYREIAKKLPEDVTSLVFDSRDILVDEIGESEVIRIEALQSYPDAQFRLLRAALYEVW